VAQAKAAQLQLLSVQSRLHDLALALSLSPPGGSPELTQVCLCTNAAQVFVLEHAGREHYNGSKIAIEV